MIRDLIPSVQRQFPSFRNEPTVSLRNAMNRLFEDFTSDIEDIGSTSLSQSLQSFMPKCDLEEKEDRILLTAELPGMSEKDVQVEMNKDYLTVRGDKKSCHEEKDGGRYFSERSYGGFERTIRLPADVNREKIDAVFKDGVLTVSMPKSPEAKKDIKKIAVHH
jgi:HSP20 family protein